MGINYFTDEQVEFLRKNKNVKKVSNKAITYTLEFKEFFVEEHRTKYPIQIFEEAGLPISILGRDRISSASKSWTKKYKERSSLIDMRKGGSGRPTKKELTQEEIIEKQKLQIEILKQENEFLRQIRRLERRYQPKQSPSKKNIK